MGEIVINGRLYTEEHYDKEEIDASVNNIMEAISNSDGKTLSLGEGLDAIARMCKDLSAQGKRKS